MQKILTSVGMIVFAAALVAGATGAFFSDTETSTGNTFTAGAIDLTVDSEQHYNNAVCVPNTETPEEGDYWWQLDGDITPDLVQYPVIGSPCDGTWLATDLGAHKFFNFLDVKPGDEGENTISLHVDSNDAYACVDVNITANDDVSSTEPELAAPDVAEDANNNFDGELAQNINFFAWADYGTNPGFQGDDAGEGDNVWQANEPALFSNVIGPASDALDGESYTLADSGTGPLAGNSTSYIGLAWCAGTLTTPAPGTLLCDGAGMGNIAQTDSMVADIAFRIEQARNNPNFVCRPPTQPEPETATLTVDKVVTFSNQLIEGVDVTDFQLHINGPGGDQIVLDQVATSGLAPGVYTVSEVYSGVPANVVFDAVFSGSCSEIPVDTETGTITLVGGDNLTCTITNTISLAP